MFSNAIKIATLQGFDIRIDPSWALIAALITWSLSAQYFPMVYPGAGGSVYLTLALLAMLGFFASLILHEMSHSVVARRYGVEIKGITLFIFGGVAELGSEPKTAASEFWIAIAGPLMSLALALGFWLLAQMGGWLAPGMALNPVLDYLALINLVLAVFNLLPAFPLDGGRIFRAFLWSRSRDLLQATATATRIGSYFAYALILFGVIGLFSGNPVASLWQVLIGVFVLAAAKGTYASQLQEAAFKGKAVAVLMTRDVISVQPEVSLKYLADDVMLSGRKSFVPVVLGDVLLGYADTGLLAQTPRADWAATHVGDVYVAADADNTVGPDMPAAELMAKISSTGRRKFLVAEDRQLLGVVTLSDLTGYLAVLQEIRLPDRKTE
ncbi:MULTISPECIES: site-2 protease family protein [unclassified Leisingera]|uniref:site-2 protease family protein n=1 Tax=unclassified Leisingera TaxID=2614906 RepID=UPI0002FB6AF2|nr:MULTISPECIES: site-2 protease family protein [unclassified Leisingera]KIC23658.1 peptidase M50 [Leisingera sp. ANG-S3]KIC52229.1 peptidase M50 [Leisingera sp. ANG-S]KID09787.1 peptidase M50 [Leisingera sp. ANG1]